MPSERFAPDDPREWLNRANSNLALARSTAAGAYLEDLCFEARPYRSRSRDRRRQFLEQRVGALHRRADAAPFGVPLLAFEALPQGPAHLICGVKVAADYKRSY